MPPPPKARVDGYGTAAPWAAWSSEVSGAWLLSQHFEMDSMRSILSTHHLGPAVSNLEPRTQCAVDKTKLASINLAGIFWNRAASAGPPSVDNVEGESRAMAQPQRSPPLSPQFCFSTGALREFLRFSRSTVDDTINQNLNALVTPSGAGFDPRSTSQRTPRSTRRDINNERCTDFCDKVLFPAWDSRAHVFEYCAAVASSPDPDDPEAALRDIQKQKDSERVIDERLDPYSGRFYPRESRTEILAATLRQERGVEDIVRHRTWEVIQDRCEAPLKDWQKAMAEWKKK